MVGGELLGGSHFGYSKLHQGVLGVAGFDQHGLECSSDYSDYAPEVLDNLRSQ